MPHHVRSRESALASRSTLFSRPPLRALGARLLPLLVAACASTSVACGSAVGDTPSDAGTDTAPPTRTEPQPPPPDDCKTTGDCVCTPGEQVSCYDGPKGTAGIGICSAGKKTCLSDGRAFGPCEGQVLPKAEVCHVGESIDEDCDGKVNEEGADCVCVPGAKEPCYDGSGGLASTELTAPGGTCKSGERTCADDGTKFGACEGQVLPAAEVCDGTLTDENCDGAVNEGGTGCECVPGTSESCWEGPESAVFGGTSICVKGTRTCSPQGTWGACEGQVLPGQEPAGVCTDEIDEDCDGDTIGTGNVDADGDGWTPCGGDCCDVPGQCTDPAAVNPGAYEFANGQDDDCNGTVDDTVASCGTGLPSNSGNALDYAKALDLCQTTTENPPPAMRKWGVISAQFTFPTGAGSPAGNARSIRTRFGTNNVPIKGPNLVVLSTGVAASRNDTNPAYSAFQPGVQQSTNTGYPADWLAANGGTVPRPAQCPESGAPQDGIMLKLRVRVPSNARSFSFNSFYMTAEYPEYTCSKFSDVFVALLDSSYASATTPNPADKNLASWTSNNVRYPITSNMALGSSLFRACLNGPIGCQGSVPNLTTSGCSLGTSLLTGTGMDLLNPPGYGGTNDGYCGSNNMTGGGTGYLTSSGNVVPREVIELRFAIWDSFDGLGDSLVLLDNLTWSPATVTPGTVPR